MLEDAFLILNSCRCLGCYEVLVSTHQYNYFMCPCENHTFTGGGTSYIHRGGEDMFLVKSQDIFSDAEHSILRTVVCRGGYGKKGEEHYRVTRLADMSDAYLAASIEFVSIHPTQNKYLQIYRNEVEYRQLHNIRIED